MRDEPVRADPGPGAVLWGSPRLSLGQRGSPEPEAVPGPEPEAVPGRPKALRTLAGPAASPVPGWAGGESDPPPVVYLWEGLGEPHSSSCFNNMLLLFTS